MSEWLDNISDKDVLQDNLTFASLYIAMFEYMKQYVVDYIKEFLCVEEVKNGKLIYKETEAYRKEILDRFGEKKVPEKTTTASFLWLVDNEAITEEDYQKFLAIKAVRNKYAHELANVIFQGISEKDVKLLLEMRDLLQKISSWFYINIDAPIMGYEIPEDLQPNDIHSGGDIVFQMILEVLYNGKSQEYKALIDKCRQAKGR